MTLKPCTSQYCHSNTFLIIITTDFLMANVNGSGLQTQHFPSTMATINTNGLQSTLPSWPIFFANNRLDILCVQETHRIQNLPYTRSWLTSHSLEIIPNVSSHEQTNPKIGRATIHTSSIVLNICDTNIIEKNKMQSITLKHKDTITLIINVYLKSGNVATSSRQRTESLSKLSDFLKNTHCDHIIIAGDFNMVLHPIDKTHKITKRQDY